MGMLDGKVVLITGALGGQGLAEAALFAREGASFILTDIRTDAVLPQDLIAANHLLLVHDVADEVSWTDVTDKGVKRFSRIDVLINNAGVYRPASLC